MPTSAPSAFDALHRDALRLGVPLGGAQVALCERFAALLIERNTVVNLTAITDPAEIARKHFLDSLTALRVRRWSGDERVVDVGSGPGFPGLALRIALPALRLTLVESVGKKARFLEDVVRELALAGVDVMNARAESLAAERRESYDVALARAVGTLGADLEYLMPLLRVGGDAIVWKGRLAGELVGGRRAVHALGGDALDVTTTEDLAVADLLPGRSLVRARKAGPTPARYPRSAAEMKKRPW